MKKLELIEIHPVLFGILLPVMTYSQNVKVTADFSVSKEYGAVKSLEREKYFNSHNSPGNEFSAEEWDYLNKVKMGIGRAFMIPGGGASVANGMSTEMLKKHAANWGKFSKKYPCYSPDMYKDMIVTSHPTPGKVKNYAFHWKGTNADYTEEAKLMADFFKIQFIDNGYSLPGYYEPMNEPYVHASDYRKISFKGYNDETIVILPENNKDLTLSVKVEDLRLAEWNFSTPSFYDSAAAGTDLLINDNTKMACCPYSTDELGLDNGGKPDNLAGKKNGYSASGIPATILKENCNNQVCKASKWLSNIYNYMAFNADAKTESKIIFEIPLPSDYKGSNIELSMDFRPLSTSPKSWKIYCADVDGEIRNYDLKNITASNATPNIIEKVFPVMTDNSGNQTVRIILEPTEEVTGAAHNNMAFLMNKVTVKRHSTYGFRE